MNSSPKDLAITNSARLILTNWSEQPAFLPNPKATNMSYRIIDTSPLDPVAKPLADALQLEYATRYREFFLNNNVSAAEDPAQNRANLDAYGSAAPGPRATGRGRTRGARVAPGLSPRISDHRLQVARGVGPLYQFRLRAAV
jgi:hypothetical protein